MLIAIVVGLLIFAGIYGVIRVARVLANAAIFVVALACGLIGFALIRWYYQFAPTTDLLPSGLSLTVIVGILLLLVAVGVFLMLPFVPYSTLFTGRKRNRPVPAGNATTANVGN